MAKSPIYLGIDLGGTKIHAVVVDDTGKVHATARAKTEPKRGYKAVIDTIASVAHSAARDAGLKISRLPAIGIGTPGPVDQKRGVVLLAPNLGWTDKPIAADLRAQFGVPVSVGNDVNMGAYGEVVFGAARGIKSAVAAFVGTGLGGAVILRGKIINGTHGYGGEIGHIPAPFTQRRCGCGRLGCLETSASKKGLMLAVAEAVAHKQKCLLPVGEDLKTSQIKDALKRHCPTTIAALDDLATAVAWGLATVGTIIDPRAFILGGGVIEGLHQVLVPKIANRIPQFSVLYKNHKPDLRSAALGDDGVAIGAAAMACL